MNNHQLQLLPDKPVTPKFALVDLSELPQILPSSIPDKAFIGSIEKFGILQPIGLIESDRGYLVAFGRRRILAARKIGLISVPAVIYPVGWTLGEVLTLVENQQRKDNLVAFLEAIESLRLQATPEEICGAVGISKAELYKAIRLIDGLIPELRLALTEGRMSSSCACQAIKLTQQQQQTLAQLSVIRAKDVDQLLRVNTSCRVNDLPETLFEEEMQVGWQVKARQLVEQLLITVPDDYHTQIEQLAIAFVAQKPQSVSFEVLKAL